MNKFHTGKHFLYDLISVTIIAHAINAAKTNIITILFILAAVN